MPVNPGPPSARSGVYERKRPGLEGPAKSNREASRLGDVGSEDPSSGLAPEDSDDAAAPKLFAATQHNWKIVFGRG
jgi:hypothetical protein